MNLPSHRLTPEALRSIILTKRNQQAVALAEDVRNSIDSKELVGQLLDLASQADFVADDLQLGVLRFKADVLKTVLKKTMPDLRSVEVTDKAQKVSKLIIDIPPTDVKQQD